MTNASYIFCFDIDVHALIARGSPIPRRSSQAKSSSALSPKSSRQMTPTSQSRSSNCPQDSMRKNRGSSLEQGVPRKMTDGWILSYAFDESQLDPLGKRKKRAQGHRRKRQEDHRRES